MSTSFLVIQAQRDLAQATTNELGAVLAYDLSLVDFEALQEAGPQGSGGTTASFVAIDRLRRAGGDERKRRCSAVHVDPADKPTREPSSGARRGRG